MQPEQNIFMYNTIYSLIFEEMVQLITALGRLTTMELIILLTEGQLFRGIPFSPKITCFQKLQYTQ
jgi:hypothetical protein